jgi:hypothetical protein
LHVNSNNHSAFYTYIGIFDEEFTPDLPAANEAVEFGWFDLDNPPSDLLPGFKVTLDEKQKTLKNIICFYAAKC